MHTEALTEIVPVRQALTEIEGVDGFAVGDVVWHSNMRGASTIGGRWIKFLEL